MTSIVSILVLIFMMATVQMVNSHKCTGLEPIKQYWNFYVGTCYVQRTYSHDGSPPPYKCAKITIAEDTDIFKGTSTLSFVEIETGETKTQTDNWTQINSMNGNPVVKMAQVFSVGNNGSCSYTVNTMVLGNKHHYLMGTCVDEESKGEFVFQKAIICSKDKVPNTGLIDMFMKQAVNVFNIPEEKLVEIDQNDCSN